MALSLQVLCHSREALRASAPYQSYIMNYTLDRERGPDAPDKLPLPPLVSAPPVVGSLRGLTGNVRAFLTECYFRHGPAFRLRIPQGELYVLAGPEANVFVTKSGADLFRSKESWQAVDREMGAERSLISSDGAYHRKMRALQKPLYARDKVSQNYDVLIHMTVGELRVWADRAEPFAAVYACQQLVTEQLGMMATGASVRPYLNDLMLWIGTVLRVHQNRARPRWWLRLPHVARARRRVMELYRATLASRAGEPYDPTNAVDLAVATNHSDPELLTEEEMAVDNDELSGAVRNALEHVHAAINLSGTAVEAFAKWATGKTN